MISKLFNQFKEERANFSNKNYDKDAFPKVDRDFMQYSKASTKSLKELCANYKLDIRGTKKQLITRILQHMDGPKKVSGYYNKTGDKEFKHIKKGEDTTTDPRSYEKKVDESMLGVVGGAAAIAAGIGVWSAAANAKKRAAKRKSTKAFRDMKKKVSKKQPKPPVQEAWGDHRDDQEGDIHHSPRPRDKKHLQAILKRMKIGQVRNDKHDEGRYKTHKKRVDKYNQIANKVAADALKALSKGTT